MYGIGQFVGTETSIFGVNRLSCVLVARGGVAKREAPLIDGVALASSRLVNLHGMLVEGGVAVGVDLAWVRMRAPQNDAQLGCRRNESSFRKAVVEWFGMLRARRYYNARLRYEQ
jgi:hypothetical protein